MNTDIKIVGSLGGIQFLKNIVNRDSNNMVVKENQILSLGDKTLRFMILPNLHWPDIIPYVSTYGYTKQLAKKISEGIKDSGDIDVRAYDMVEALEPIWELTIKMFAKTYGGKLAGALQDKENPKKKCDK